MRLPAAERAYVDPAKLRDYLLSPIHPEGQFKAAFFGRLGYRRANWPRLQRDLERLALSDSAIPAQPNQFGRLFELRIMLRGPTGDPRPVVTVWIVRREEDFPRLVTAYPGVLR
jgi:hypothetical protein